MTANSRSSNLFLIGSRRSGTNLLRLLLDAHPSLVAPHVPDLIIPFLPLEDRYQRPGGLKDLIADVVEFIYADPVPWHLGALDEDAIASGCRDSSVFSVLCSVLEYCKRECGGDTWVQKEPKAIMHWERLDHYTESARYLLLHRDPRDVLCSYRRIPHYAKHPFVVARQWSETQHACLDAMSSLPAERVMRLGYEQLVKDPRAEVDRICGFLGVGYDVSMMAFHERSAATQISASGEKWQSLDKPVSTGSLGRYLKELEEWEIGLVESVAGPAMDALGYRRSVTRAGASSAFEPEEIRRFEVENEELVRDAVSKLEPHRWERSRPQEQLLERIRAGVTR